MAAHRLEVAGRDAAAAGSSNRTRILAQGRTDEVCSLGARSKVAVGFEAPEHNADVDAIGALRLLEAIRFLGPEKATRFEACRVTAPSHAHNTPSGTAQNAGPSGSS